MFLEIAWHNLRLVWACSIQSKFYLTARTLCSGVKGAFLREWIEGEVVRSTNRQLCIGEVSDIPSLQKWKWIQTHILGKCKICFAAECIFNWLHHKWGCRALLIFLPICQRGLSCHKRAIIIATTQKTQMGQIGPRAVRYIGIPVYIRVILWLKRFSRT